DLRFRSVHAAASMEGTVDGVKVRLKQLLCRPNQPSWRTPPDMATDILTLGLGRLITVYGCGFVVDVTNVGTKPVGVREWLSRGSVATVDRAWPVNRVEDKSVDTIEPGDTSRLTAYAHVDPKDVLHKPLLLVIRAPRPYGGSSTDAALVRLQ